MPRKSSEARAATHAALRLRYRAGIGLTEPASPIDVAEKFGISVWFLRAPSMEGMLVKAPHAQIVLSSLRPAGRINFTCAHELGHFWFGHGIHVDLADSSTPALREDKDDEFVADRFASALLMPKTTVQSGFVRRRVEVSNALPHQVLAVANWLGVGYTTLVNHLRIHLDILSESHARDLLRHRPKQIASELMGRKIAGPVILVDRSWRSRPIDLIVGDTALIEGEASAIGTCVALVEVADRFSLVSAVAPGAGLIDGGAGWSSHVRVRRAEYEGRSIYRHLEEVEDRDD